MRCCIANPKRAARSGEQSATGILVSQRVLSGGPMVGGEYGDGVLRTGSRVDGYYRLVGGSFGFLAGAQSQAIVLMFLTQQALDRFRKSSGWTAGVDASVAVANVGATGDIDTNTAKQWIVGFALTNAGLYAGLKIDGSKITGWISSDSLLRRPRPYAAVVLRRRMCGLLDASDCSWPVSAPVEASLATATRHAVCALFLLQE